MKIIMVSSAEEAFLVVKSYNFDIIFLDICMPKIDGIKTCKELKKTLKTPIIATSSVDYSFSNIIDNLFDDVLNKPIKKKPLVKVLTKYLEYETN
jgi:CheY-like chemotaxis protein